MQKNLDAPKSAKSAETPSPFHEVRTYIVFGIAVIATLLGGLGVWAATADLAGAILASGSVVVDSSVKKVQHPTGGVIGAINVTEGQHVEAGDLLIRLDETVTRANLQMVVKLLDEISVRQARLKAEQDDRAEITYPKDILARQSETVLAEIMASETALFKSRREAREGLRSQLRERIAQLREEIEGLTAQQNSRRQEHDFANAELEGLEQLEGKNLVSTPRITAARRSVAQLDGDIAQVMATTAQAKGKIAEIELQILQLDQDLKTEVGKELRDQQGRQAELSERRVAAEDQLKRIELRAPQSGTVHQLAVHTVGGVISPSEPVMLIVPNADRLVIDAKVAPQDIDQVRVGQIAHVRFSAFNQRTTPDMTATVSRVSADLMMDHARAANGAPSEGVPYYSVRLTLTADAQEKLGDLKLIPGMPAEVHIATGDRTALTYFSKPLTDQFARAFRER
ncbi:HlyD family type I secretion periplasmic adaptor subunit [Hyphomicrobium sp. LHD-15]|uniref:HlyD family type I secretion periplasmic adaptor subunit n=1 Tax=Hyphomicrobium sp. LHD-15 TaxID=3072142 RepID=UPI00280C7B43|nr:HlyD family type I secretion periplasmic adaptor subunit [Hyphomicrobium sp. LHD-15]MDQ8698206.1 HlyD family type I secretion periplasmic adaptor subunit [Hyphomicrobium sp. LHD-15]